MKIAIIGASGFIGRHLGKVLAGDGHAICPVGRGDPLPQDFFDVAIDCNGDARRFWACENPAQSFAVTVAATAERLFGLKTKRYVYLSTIDVYGQARAARTTSREDAPIDQSQLDAYGFHKLLADRLVAFHAPDHLILRLGTVIGPGLKKNPIYDATHGLPIRQTPDSTLSLIDLHTIGQAVQALFAQDASGVFNLTGRASIQVRDLIEIAAHRQGRAPSDFVFHQDLLHTDYEVNVEAASRVLPLPTSTDMLESYLESLLP